MAFGTKQLKNPTPEKAIWRVRIFSAIVGVLMLWMPTAAFIPYNVQDVATSILGLALAISNAILPFFGVKTDQKNVPIKDVGSMQQEDEQEEKSD